MELCLWTMVKKDNKLIGIVADEEDLRYLEYLRVKLGLKPTQIYRLALRTFYRSERKMD